MGIMTTAELLRDNTCAGVLTSTAYVVDRFMFLVVSLYALASVDIILLICQRRRQLALRVTPSLFLCYPKLLNLWRSRTFF